MPRPNRHAVRREALACAQLELAELDAEKKLMDRRALMLHERLCTTRRLVIYLQALLEEDPQ